MKNLGLCITFLCLIVGFTELQASRKNDFQIWTQFGAKTYVNEEFLAFGHVAFRFDDNASRLFYQYIQGGFSWSPEASWIITPIYRQALSKETDRKGKEFWKAEAVPILDVTKIWDYCYFEVLNRNRFQHRSINNDWFYRNRSTARFPKPDIWGEIAPFVSEEFFVRNLEEISQNRVSIGVEADYPDYAHGFFAYMLQHKKSMRMWQVNHIIQCYLDIYF